MEDEWILHHHLKEGTDPDEEEEGAVVKIPLMPVIENPGYFVIKLSWTAETTILRKREEHLQQLQSFLWKTNIEQAVNLELTHAIPKALIGHHTDIECTLTANIKLILDHMEETYDKIHPNDINNNTNTCNTLTQCPHTLIGNRRQQGCKKLLRTTKESILTATMIRTSLGYFQRLPYMSKACEEWEEYKLEQDNLDQHTTWKEFKKIQSKVPYLQ